ncbi:chorismate lyase [Pseudomonas citronellolis]|uniref:Probable chorismate pyruvate-lyase n=1 Tax=Pseudomonas citronellolis TaxID=53408 RepID=A0AAQ1KIP1_9PSED|nr:chorismate--pyruvate lyase [Pseudomonas citronellolis]MCP1657227.1 chorismate--pyruvate lyase [Pseudomonas citronellolis]MCP1724040.1 chorismate--pyruvate lyase [Pseudomonas citronellolis]GBL58841.1 chorismate--pyruvate lyase [Pseudomonas citronellolis]SFD46529.1 chorismate lyase [Pseudomonas citronellolis]
MSDLSVPLPNWLNEDQLPANVEPAVHDWLFDQGSLTRRLTALAEGAFSVEPLLEGWQVLRDDECKALGVPSHSQGWVREVYLRGHGQPWVFARSVAARSALEASGFDLAQLGSRSLGELLFSDSAFRRDVIEVCLYPAPFLPLEVRRALLWGRRSCFRRDRLGVLVAEVFLPRLWRAAGVEAV